MIHTLHTRCLQPMMGQLHTWASVLRDRKARAQWKPGRGIVNRRAIWYKPQMIPCTCGAKGHLIADGVPYSTQVDQVRYACICTQCGRITRPYDCGSGYLSKGFISPHEAARNAIRAWNNGITPPPRNPLSIPLNQSFLDAVVIY